MGILTGSVHTSEARADDLPLDRMREVYGQCEAADDRLVFAIVDRASGRVVGESVLNEWDEGNRSC